MTFSCASILEVGNIISDTVDPFQLWRWRTYVPPSRQLVSPGGFETLYYNQHYYVHLWVRFKFTNIGIYKIINSMEMSSPWEAASRLKNLPKFCGTRRFALVFIRTIHWSLPLARATQSIQPRSISLQPISILSYHLRLGLLVGFFLLALPPKSYMHSYSFPCVLRALQISPPFTWLSNYTWWRVHDL